MFTNASHTHTHRICVFTASSVWLIWDSFTFMHLADAFIQSDLHCIQVTVLHFISSCFPWESSWRCAMVELRPVALPFELQESRKKHLD